MFKKNNKNFKLHKVKKNKKRSKMLNEQNSNVFSDKFGDTKENKFTLESTSVVIKPIIRK